MFGGLGWQGCQKAKQHLKPLGTCMAIPHALHPVFALYLSQHHAQHQYLYTKNDCDFSENSLPPQSINNLVSLPNHFHFHFSSALSSLCLFLLHFVTGSLSVCHSGESLCSVASKILAAEKPAN